MNAAFTIVMSCFMIFSKRYIEHLTRVVNGGYVLQSRVIIGFLELTGALWGVIGMIGTWQQRAVYVRIYNYFQMARVISWFGMFCTDIPVLLKCEMWQTDIAGAMKEQGWNPIMYEVALSGNCVKERTLFFIFSFAAFFFLHLPDVREPAASRYVGERAKILVAHTQGFADGGILHPVAW